MCKLQTFSYPFDRKHIILDTYFPQVDRYWTILVDSKRVYNPSMLKYYMVSLFILRQNVLYVISEFPDAAFLRV